MCCDFRHVIPHINNSYEERVFVAIQSGNLCNLCNLCGNLCIELIIVIGSNSITPGKLEKLRKRKAINSKYYLVALD